VHFLVVKLSSIGDVVHTLPAVAALRAAYPQSRITWIVERSAAVILQNSKLIDELLVVDTRRWRRQLLQRETWQLIRTQLGRLRARPIDVVFDFQGLCKSAIIAALAQSQYRVGFSNDGLREPASRYFLTHQVVIGRQMHVIDKNLQLVASLGVKPPSQYEFPIEVLAEDETYIKEWQQRANIKQFAILNPGGGWVTKLWSTERFAAVADWLAAEYNLASLVTYGPGEESLATEIVTQARSSQVQMINTTLPQFVALARQAALFIGSDTGPLHLAAACRTPIVGIYGPTEPARNGPFDPLDITVGLELDCRPNCYRRRCPTIDCLDIPTSLVTNAIARRLSQTKLWQLQRYNKH
jgi:heptosyltransferase I